jgi:hypothetical protein
VLRLSRSRVISDIEFIINNPGPALGQRKWISKGTECDFRFNPATDSDLIPATVPI